MPLKERTVALIKQILHGEDESWWGKYGPDVYEEARALLVDLEKA